MTNLNELPAEARELVELLHLAPLPEEGGLFRQAYIDEHSTAIYFLLAGGDFSALHVLTGPEVYHYYAGAPLQMLFLHPDGRVEEPVLGPDVAAGQRPQIVAAPGVWQGSSSTGSWTLLGTTMAPGYRYEDFTLGDRTELTAKFPQAAARISALTR